MGTRNSDQDLWLAEASSALAEAERLTGLLALARTRDELALAALQAQIIGLRREIEHIQRQRTGERRREFHPHWLEFSAWNAAR